MFYIFLLLPTIFYKLIFIYDKQDLLVLLSL